MGSISGRKLSQVIKNLEYILAIELLCACQAIEFRRPLKSSALLEAAHEFVREYVGFAEEDRIFSQDINAIHALVSDGSFVERVDEVAGGSYVRLNEGYEKFDL